jgi:hypothetical protein
MSLQRKRALFLTAFLCTVSCAATVPKAELDRCKLGVADGNDSYTVRQAVACRMVAQRLAADDQQMEAMGYARKSCQLEDPGGCERYLSLARAQAALPPDELLAVRAAGEKACAGIVVGADQTDSRPRLCVKTAELYLDLDPRSKSDAGRLYTRACKLGDKNACGHARALGVEDPEAEEKPTAASKQAPPAPQAPAPRPAPPRAAPGPAPSPAASVSTAPPSPPCHEMRSCVSLELKQRNMTEVVGTMTSHCDHPVSCTWCPSKGDQVDKSACRTTTIGPGETKSGQGAGLWYDGFNAMAYDCMDVGDDSRCLSL